MSKAHKQTFLQGALILAVANVIVKIIGAGFKIPLARLIGEDGGGLFNTAYTMYTWMFVIATAGLPVAVSKMVSESIARNNRYEAHRIFHVAFYLLSFIGMIGTAVLFFGARFFADILSNSRAAVAIMAVSPALLFVAIMSAYRGYFQGMQNMIPTAVSEVIEALGKLIIGYILASIWLHRGVEYSAAGAVLGVSAGAFLGAAGLYFIYQVYHGKMMEEVRFSKERSVKVKPAGRILKELVKIAIPITIGASVFSLTNVIDLALVMNRLSSIGLGEVEVSSLYGSYSMYAVPLFNLPPTLISSLSISIVPVIASALAVHNTKLAKATTESALRITMLFALPCAVGLSVLSEPILQFVYDNANATTLLQILGIAVVFVSMVMVSNAILQASGKVMIPVRNMFIGGAAKVISNYILVGIPQINIHGAPIGTNLCYIIIITLNLLEVKKVTGAEYKFTDFFVKPLIAVGSMAVSVLFGYNKFIEIWQSNSLATIGAIVVGAVIYTLMLFAVRAVKKEDIEMLPKGKGMVKALNRMKLLK